MIRNGVVRLLREGPATETSPSAAFSADVEFSRVRGPCSDTVPGRTCRGEACLARGYLCRWPENSISCTANGRLRNRSIVIALETERLVLRRLTLNDAPFIVELLNEPSFLRYIGD